MPTLLALTLLVTLAVLAARSTAANAHTPYLHPDGQLSAPKAHWIAFLRSTTNRVRRGKCLRPYRFRYRPAYRVPVDRRPAALRTWKPRRLAAVRAGSRCAPASPVAVIRYVFPDHAEDEAIRVAGCESTGNPGRLNPRAKNPSSSASGLFQELDSWWATSNNFLGRPFDPFNALLNARQALWLWRDSGGSFRWHWAASAGCWS